MRLSESGDPLTTFVRVFTLSPPSSYLPFTIPWVQFLGGKTARARLSFS